MVIQILIYAAIFIVLGIFMALVSFHVKRFRYANDASLYVLVSLVVVFLLTGVLTFILFDYSGSATSRPPLTTNDRLL